MLSISEMKQKTFTTTRQRGGYEIAEVDQFRIDVVELITVLDDEIKELREDLATAQMRPADASMEQGHTDAWQGTPATAGPVLELVALTADQLVTDAMGEADSLLSSARAEAEQLIMASRVEAARITAELARHTEKQTAELDQHRSAVLAEVATTKAALEAEVEALRHLESQHRNHLRHHLAEQLARLEETEPAIPLAAAE